MHSSLCIHDISYREKIEKFYFIYINNRILDRTINIRDKKILLSLKLFIPCGSYIYISF